MYAGGYSGKVLRINLSEKTYKEEPLPFEYARDFIGGAGFGIKYLFDELKAGIDPLGVENKLIYALGPFTGSPVPCSSRFTITSKSPATGAVGMALSGGHFPVEMRRTGYDVIIIEGKAEKPTYLFITPGKVRFRDAGRVWGLLTSDTQQVIKEELKDHNIRVSCIGPAGENQSKMAGIFNELRAAGRKGIGAVMGAKNLKAVAVRGEVAVPIASEEKFAAAKKALNQAMVASPGLFPVFAKVGTGCALPATGHFGIFSAKNWTATGEFVPLDAIGLEAQATQKLGNARCANCSVGCTQVLRAKKGCYAGIVTEGPEFETYYSFGGQLVNDNLDSIIAADRLADELGLDSISAGVAVGFAMELFERGILTAADTGGMELKWGDHEALIKLLRMMAFREGVGDLLADGVKAAAARIGKGSEGYAMHVKGLELPAYDVRGAKAQGLNYATAYTGADHNRGYAPQEIFGLPFPFPVDRFAYEGKGVLTKWNQDLQTATADCPVLCSFIVLMALLENGTKIVGDLLEALSGIPYTADEVMRVGERVNNLARAFNAREGFGRKDDVLPDRLMNEPITEGLSKGQRVSPEDLNRMLDEYYQVRGWDLATGTPTRAKLVELGLGYVADQLGV
jgi:aldehyde:ferredoxin oxidoreductase